MAALENHDGLSISSMRFPVFFGQSLRHGPRDEDGFARIVRTA